MHEYGNGNDYAITQANPSRRSAAVMRVRSLAVPALCRWAQTRMSVLQSAAHEKTVHCTLPTDHCPACRAPAYRAACRAHLNAFAEVLYPRYSFFNFFNAASIAQTYILISAEGNSGNCGNMFLADEFFSEGK